VADFVIKEWDLAPYPGYQAPPHIHHGSDEAFYVLGGQLEVLTGNERRIVPAGQLAFVEAGTVHTFTNHGPANCRVLVIMTPEVDQLIAALHEPDQDKAGVWARFNSSVVSAP